MISRWLLHWRAKLVCLLIALIVWTALKNRLEPGVFERLVSGAVSSSTSR